jgi:hypothetical protein
MRISPFWGDTVKRRQARKRKNRRRRLADNVRVDRVKTSESCSADDIIFVSNAGDKMSEVILEFADLVLELAETRDA